MDGNKTMYSVTQDLSQICLKMKKTDLIREAKISSNVLAKMGKEESVSLESIGKICSLFGCNVDDILEFQSPEQITTDSGE